VEPQGSLRVPLGSTLAAFSIVGGMTLAPNLSLAGKSIRIAQKLAHMMSGEAERESRLHRLFSWMEDQVDDWALSLEDTFEAQFFRGIMLPLLLLALGLCFIFNQKLGLCGYYDCFWHQRPAMVLTGWGVAALGMAMICVGLCLHFHCFWRVRAPRAGAVGMFIALALAVVFSLGVIVGLVQRA
jgi:hypothetical protein